MIRNFGRSAIYLQTNGSNVVEGNYLGLDSTGTAARANGWDGVSIVSGSNNRIGGTTVAQRNVIAGNAEDGVYVEAGSTGNTIQGNYIGLNASGTAAVPNGWRGIVLNGGTNVVGGTASGAGNTVSGNGWRGILIAGSSNVVQGNIVGLDASGNAVVSNGSNGISIEGGSGNVIGGSTASARNVISGNNQAQDVADGIWITNSTGNVIRGNYIGTDATGTLARGNYNAGVAIWSDGNFVGGTGTGDGNLIAYNGSDGVIVAQASRDNRILGNRFTGNGGLAIDLGDDGVTLNDGSTSGGDNNREIDYPVFTAASISGGLLTVSGYVGSAPGQSTFANDRVEIYVADGDPSGYGEGRAYLGFLTTDGGGRFSGSISSGPLVVGQRVTGTTTDSEGNTSEFGANYTATQVASAPGTGPLAEWRFEEAAWTGASDQVLDSSGNANHLTSYGGANTAAATGGSGTCRYGDFNGGSDRVGTYTDQRMSMSVAVTAMAWIYARALPTNDIMTILSKDSNYEFHLDTGGQIYWWWGGGARALTTSGTALAPGSKRKYRK
ncbi:right-handed parallel beta-helix repeat-containing protein [Accumulibacter sp.]|uniref:beta strand repeat-containing protein n=1 Tax=Accumulibacter sp. TaxID=2053492 RepID=UPI001AC64EF5|nr:right-handed parallel beta-helix repeat-containing protein [Accumulibacter sp.]MBN8456028.1 right-handed parallel beta-helix repeat-containing protein [Accumulibacter sp.]